MKRQRGFTLVEVLVVVAVIGMLASMAIPVFKGAMNKAKRNSAMVGLRVLRESMDQYHGDTGSYPNYFTFNMATLAPVVPSHLKRATPVLRHLDRQRLDFYLPWDVFSSTGWDFSTLTRPMEYTLFATLAFDDDAYVVMTDKQTWLWNGSRYVPFGQY